MPWVRQRRRRTRRVALFASGFAGVLLVAAAIAIAMGYRDLRVIRNTAEAARADLAGMQATAESLETPEGRARLIAVVGGASDKLAAADARRRRSTPLRLVSALPIVGRQARGIRYLVDDAVTGTAIAREMLGLADRLAGEAALVGGRVPIETVRELGVTFARAEADLRGLHRSSAGLWGPVAESRQRLNALSVSYADRLGTGARIARVSAELLGGTEARRWFLAAQNNAEMRDQGMVLSYGILDAADGVVSVSHTGPIAELALRRPVPIPLPPGTDRVFGSIVPTQQWRSVNGSADFPLSGRLMTAMYEAATSNRVDGVLAVDVPALANLLRVTGPITVEGVPEPIDADNVARIVLKDLYDTVPHGSSQGPRRELLAELTQIVVDRIKGQQLNAIAVSTALARSVGGGHLRLYSADATEQADLEELDIAGNPASDLADRTFHIAVENRTATKLDYYIRPRVRMQVRVTDQGTAIVRTTLAVQNDAPVGARPSYALGPDQFSEKPGDYTAWGLLWGPAGSSQLGSVEEAGLRLSEHIFLVRAGETQRVQFETVIRGAVRNGRLDLRLVPQPRLRPVDIEVSIDAPDWVVQGQDIRRFAWNRTQTVTFPLRRR